MPCKMYNIIIILSLCVYITEPFKTILIIFFLELYIYDWIT